MTVRAVGLEACRVAWLEHALAIVFDQHDFAFENEDQLVLLLMPVAQRRGGARLQRGEIDAELVEANGVAQALAFAADDHAIEWRRVAGARIQREFGDVDLRHGGSVPDRFAGFAEKAAAVVVALHDEIHIGILHSLTLGARADFEVDRVVVSAIDKTMSDATAGFEAAGVPRLEDRLAIVLVQDQLALKHINELILVLMGVAQRGSRAWFDARDVDAELSQPGGIADALLLTPGYDRRKFPRIRSDRLRRNLRDGDLGHGPQTRSMIVAVPMPAPMHSVIKAVAASRRSSSSSTVPRIIAPVAPSGWPMAMAPPLTLTLAASRSNACR